jgi:opacity protein-like surface antigen
MRLYYQRIAWVCIATLAFAMPIAADQHEEAEAVAEAVEADAEAAAETAGEAVEEAAAAVEEAADEAEAAVEEAAEAEPEPEPEPAKAKKVEVGDYEATGLYLVANALYAIPLEKGDLEDKNNANLMATSTNVDDSFGYGARLGYRAHKHFAIEAEFDRIVEIELDTQTLGVESKTEVSLYNLTGNAKIYPLTGRFQPFVMGGAGWGRSKSDPDAANAKRDDGFVARVGGGIDIYGSRDVALTTEVSYVMTPGLEDLDHLSIKAGLVLRFYGD